MIFYSRRLDKCACATKNYVWEGSAICIYFIFLWQKKLNIQFTPYLHCCIVWSFSCVIQNFSKENKTGNSIWTVNLQYMYVLSVKLLCLMVEMWDYKHTPCVSGIFFFFFGNKVKLLQLQHEIWMCGLATTKIDRRAMHVYPRAKFSAY